MRDDELLAPWWEAIASQIGDVAPFDVHTHTGDTDPDGFASTDTELLAALDLVGGGRAVIFPFHVESGAYPEENDRVIAEAAASGGRLHAFCRVDPRSHDAPREAQRALDAGALGVKLHPRSEGFTLGEPEVREVFAVAHERRRPVIVHAGRGIPALGQDAVRLCRELPGAQVILAHAAVSDLAWIWQESRALPNLFFDTAWWAGPDFLSLFALVAPGQILYGSDAPYGTPLLNAILTVRFALQAGLRRDQLETVMGGQTERLLAGDEALDLGPPPGKRMLGVDPLGDRIAMWLESALGLLFGGADAAQQLGLARLACDVPAGDPLEPSGRSVASLLDRRERAATSAAPGPHAPGLHLIVAAACLARTPSVPLPSPDGQR